MTEGVGPGRAGRFLWDLLLRVQRLAMLVAIVFATSAIAIEVVMRYVFRSSFVGVQELAAYTALWLYFSGAAYSTYTRGHISADLAHLFLKKTRHLGILKLLTNAVSFGLTLYVLPWAWRYFEWGFTRHEQSSSTLFGRTYDIVFFQASILVGIALMAFYFGVECFRIAAALIRTGDVPAEFLREREEIQTWI
jgi:TRAP-type C4-dicarboxylate transport system permease small subunit